MRRWRAEMPDAVLRAALLPHQTWADAQSLLIDMARIAHRQLLPHLHFSLGQRLGGHALEPEMRSARLYNGLRNKKVRQERNEVVAQLQAGGVEALVFKGADLAYSSYPDPCCRLVGDIDLLIEEARFEHAVEILMAQGWTTPDGSVHPARKYVSRSMSLRHLDFGVSLDVHDHANHHAICAGTDQIYFERSATRREDGGLEIRALCPEHSLLQVCCHGAAQNFYPPVRWAADAVWILRAAGEGFDWDVLLAAARNNNARLILSVSLAYLQLVLDIAIPTGVLREMGRALVRRSYRTAWSFRLDEPRGHVERASAYMSRFREARPGDGLLQALPHAPDFLCNTQGTESSIVALCSLARKAVRAKYNRTPSSRSLT
ncbi:MAG: nucleotidyltransferase family protein [Verrucomicrobiaceae bacterium]